MTTPDDCLSSSVTVDGEFYGVIYQASSRAAALRVISGWAADPRLSLTYGVARIMRMMIDAQLRTANQFPSIPLDELIDDNLARGQEL